MIKIDAVKKIKESLTKDMMQDIISSSGRKYTDHGDSLRTTCPVHDGNNPTAFVWNYDNGLWYCFTGSCGGGDIFDLYKHLYNVPDSIPFTQLVRIVAVELGIDIDGLEIKNREEGYIREVSRWIDYVMGNSEGENKEYNLDLLGDLYSINNYRGFTKETLDRFGVRFSSAQQRVVVPIHDKEGMCIGATMRAVMKNQSPKWKNEPKHVKTSHVIYNANRVEGDTIFIVEGVTDVWSLYQKGIKNVGAILGSNLSDEQNSIIVKNYTDVILMFDGDKAGREGIKKAVEKLKNTTNLYVVPILEGEDPDTLTQEFVSNIANQIVPYHQFSTDI